METTYNFDIHQFTEMFAMGTCQAVCDKMKFPYMQQYTVFDSCMATLGVLISFM